MIYYVTIRTPIHGTLKHLMATKDKTITRVFRLNECTWDAADVDSEKKIIIIFSTPFDTHSQHHAESAHNCADGTNKERERGRQTVCHVQQKKRRIFSLFTDKRHWFTWGAPLHRYMIFILALNILLDEKLSKHPDGHFRTNELNKQQFN